MGRCGLICGLICGSSLLAPHSPNEWLKPSCICFKSSEFAFSPNMPSTCSRMPRMISWVWALSTQEIESLSLIEAPSALSETMRESFEAYFFRKDLRVLESLPSMAEVAQETASTVSEKCLNFTREVVEAAAAALLKNWEVIVLGSVARTASLSFSLNNPYPRADSKRTSILGLGGGKG